MAIYPTPLLFAGQTKGQGGPIKVKMLNTFFVPGKDLFRHALNPVTCLIDKPAIAFECYFLVYI